MRSWYHEPSFSCPSLVESELTWLYPEERMLAGKKNRYCITISNTISETTVQSLQLEIFATHFQASLGLCLGLL